MVSRTFPARFSDNLRVSEVDLHFTAPGADTGGRQNTTTITLRPSEEEDEWLLVRVCETEGLTVYRLPGMHTVPHPDPTGEEMFTYVQVLGRVPALHLTASEIRHVDVGTPVNDHCFLELREEEEEA